MGDALWSAQSLESTELRHCGRDYSFARRTSSGIRSLGTLGCSNIIIFIFKGDNDTGQTSHWRLELARAEGGEQLAVKNFYSITYIYKPVESEKYYPNT